MTVIMISPEVPPGPPVAVNLMMYHDSLLLFLISNILAYVLVNYPCYFVRN